MKRLCHIWLVRTMNPEPLDKKGFNYETFCKESMFQVEKEFFHISDLKSACEFYLKYKDKPLSLYEEIILSEEEKEELKTLLDDCIEQGLYDEYDDWLFKLAFKDVFGGD